MLAPLEVATLDDLGELFRLRREAETWLAQRQIRQWVPGEVRPQEVREQLLADQWRVLRADDHLRGGLRLLWSDELVWQEESLPAAYVHGLMIDRRYAGQGVGESLLAWAEQQAWRAAVNLVRLDCVETNHGLRRYYQRLGFVEVGRRDFDGPWFSAVLLEKRLAPQT